MAFTIVGLVVLLLGIGMVVSHVRVWRTQQEESNVDKSELRSQHWQFRRRMMTSSLMAFVGLLILIGQFIDRKAHPMVFIFVWIVVIFIAVVMMLLAMIDFAVVRRRLKTKLVILEAKRKQLEKEAKLLQQQQEGNHELN